MAGLSENKSTVNKIVDSYEITDLYVPTQSELTTTIKPKEETKTQNTTTQSNTSTNQPEEKVQE